MQIDGRAIFANYATGKIISRIHFKKQVSVVKFSPNSALFAIAYPKFVQIWKLPDAGQFLYSATPLSQLLRVRCHSEAINAVFWSPCSRYLLTASADTTVKLLYIPHKRQKIKFHPYTLTGHKDPIIGSYFTSNINRIITISQEGAIMQWHWVFKKNSKNVSTLIENLEDNFDGNENRSLEAKVLYENDVSESDSFDVDNGSVLDTGEEAGDPMYFPSSLTSVKRWVARERQYLNLTNRNIVTCADFSSTRDLLVVGLSSGVFMIFDFSGEDDGIVTQQMTAFSSPLASVKFSTRADWIGLATHFQGHGQVVVWEWASEQFQLRQRNILAPAALAIAPDGSVFATGGSDGVHLWDPMTNFTFATLSPSTSEDIAVVTGEEVCTLAFGKEGRLLASGTTNGTIRIFDMLRYRNFRTVALPTTGSIVQLVIDPLGEIVVAAATCTTTMSGSPPFGIFIWNITDGHLVDILGSHQGPITSIVLDPVAGRWIISGSMDKSVRLFDIFKRGTSNCSSAVLTFSSEITSIVARPDGTEVAISLLSGTIVFCTTDSLTQITSIENPHTWSSLCYSADSSLLFAIPLLQKKDTEMNVFFFGMAAQHRPLLSLLFIDRTSFEKIYSSATSSILASAGGSLVILIPNTGLLHYCLDHAINFDPIELTVEISPSSIYSSLQENLLEVVGTTRDISIHSLVSILVMALKLNQAQVLNTVLITIGVKANPLIKSLTTELPSTWACRLLVVMAQQFFVSHNDYIEILLCWAKHLLLAHAFYIRRLVQHRGSSGHSLYVALRQMESLLLKNYQPLTQKAISLIDTICILPTLAALSKFNI